MFGESLDRRELFFGLLAAFQSAGMHSSASEFKASKEYRPDAMWLNNSVFDMLEKDEDF